MNTARPYRQAHRAEATAATRQKILDATVRLFRTSWYDEISLRQVAREAGVALQTVVNHFETKAGLAAAAVPHFGGDLDQRRDAVAPGDVSGGVAVLVDEYERLGDSIVRALSLEGRIPEMTDLLSFGRGKHRQWVERIFEEALPEPGAPGRERRVAVFVVATDVLTWKLLRRDQGLSRDETELAMRELAQQLSSEANWR